MAKAEWKRIEGFPEYEVSNTGEVRFLFTGKHLSQYYGGDGHFYVNLLRDGRIAKRNVHVIEVIAFLGHRSNSRVIHKDGNKMNNELDNLAWEYI